jgi:protein required for attachment to host cells
MRMNGQTPKLLDWVLVANSGRARVFVRDPENGALREFADFIHPQRRLRASEMGRDRGGYAFKGAARTQFQLHSDDASKQHASFAREVGVFLSEAAKARRFERLSVLASDPFLGMLRHALGATAQARLETSLPLDLCAYGGSDLEQRVTRALASASTAAQAQSQARG